MTLRPSPLVRAPADYATNGKADFGRFVRAFEDVFASLPPSPKPARGGGSRGGGGGGGVLPSGPPDARRNSRMPAPPEANKHSGNFLSWDETAPPAPAATITGRVRAAKVRVRVCVRVEEAESPHDRSVCWGFR